MRFFLKSVLALLAAAILVAGCSGSGTDSDTYLRFQIEDQRYELDHVTLGLMALPRDGWHFLDLGQDVAKANIVTAVPSATIQWRMNSESLNALEGRVIDLDKVNDPEMAAPAALFRTTDDISAYSHADSTLTVTITAVSGDFVEGTFEAIGLSYGSDTRGDFKNVNVSGSYRARIER